MVAGTLRHPGENARAGDALNTRLRFHGAISVLTILHRDMEMHAIRTLSGAFLAGRRNAIILPVTDALGRGGRRCPTKTAQRMKTVTEIAISCRKSSPSQRAC